MESTPVPPNLLDGLTSEEHRAILALVRPMSFAHGAVLFRQGTKPDGCYLLQQGEVALSTRLPGLEETLAEIAGPGELVGEMVLVSEAPRAQTATARGAVTALFIEARNIAALRMVMNSPLQAKLAHGFAASLARRVRGLLRLAAAVLEQGPVDPVERAPLGASEQPGCSFDIVPFLPLLPFFAELASSEIASLLEICTPWELPRGRWLFSAGDP